MMVLFREMSRRLDKLEADMEALKKIVETHTKNAHSRGYRAHASLSAANAGKHIESPELILWKVVAGEPFGKACGKTKPETQPPTYTKGTDHACGCSLFFYTFSPVSGSIKEISRRSPRASAISCKSRRILRHRGLQQRGTGGRNRSRRPGEPRRA